MPFETNEGPRSHLKWPSSQGRIHILEIWIDVAEAFDYGLAIHTHVACVSNAMRSDAFWKCGIHEMSKFTLW